MKRSTLVFATAAALLFLGATHAQDFALGFDTASTAIRGPAGPVSFEVFATLTTSNNTDPDGAQGWSISVAVAGGTAAISVKGVKVSTIFDDDDDPTTPLVNPFELDLNGAGFKVSQAASLPADPAVKGVVSAIVLHQTQKMVLQPNGKQQIAKITVNAEIPAEGENMVTLSFLNGLKGAGQPVNNVVTFKGASQAPALGDLKVTLSAPTAEFRLALVEVGGTPAASGDTDLIKEVDAGDVSLEVHALLTTTLLPPPDGPQGWSLSIAHEGDMTDATPTVKGVHVSTIFDEDDDPSTPLVDPFDLDLNGAGFKVAQKATGDYMDSPIPGKVGVVSAIVLHQTQKMVLHANATDTLLKITYKFTIAEGEMKTGKAFFLDGLKGAGQPVKNVITYLGQSKTPTSAQALNIKLTGRVPPKKDNFIRGDANDDNKVDIADGVYIVYSVVPSLASTGDYGVACRDAGDSNDDELLNLADAVHIINYQFRGGPAPAGPNVCGTDDDSTEASCPPESTECP